VVRVALKRVGVPAWEVRDNVVVNEAADHVSLVRIDGSVTKVSALVTSVSTPETAVSLDIVPDRPYS
jgi:hypothetical protein